MKLTNDVLEARHTDMKQSLVIVLSPFIEATDSKCNHHQSFLMASWSICPQATGSPAAATGHASTRCTLTVTAAQKPQQRPDNMLVSGVVSGLTTALRVAGIR